MSLLSPLESTADLAIVVGAVGILTGLGGKYFFAIPVMDPPSAGFGKDAFDTSTPGVWNGVPGMTNRSSKGNLFTLAGIKTALTIEFGLEIATLGLDGDLNTNYYGLDGTHTAFDWGNGAGPLGKRSGWIFLGLMAGGIIARGGLPGLYSL